MYRCGLRSGSWSWCRSRRWARRWCRRGVRLWVGSAGGDESSHRERQSDSDEPTKCENVCVHDFDSPRATPYWERAFYLDWFAPVNAARVWLSQRFRTASCESLPGSTPGSHTRGSHPGRKTRLPQCASILALKAALNSTDVHANHVGAVREPPSPSLCASSNWKPRIAAFALTAS